MAPSSRAWQVEGAFGVEQLTLVDVPLASPGPGEVQVRVDAVSLNYRDLLMVRGAYDPRQPLPLVPCSDAACVVEAVGPGSRWQVGDRVLPLFAQAWLAGPPTPQRARSTLGGPLPGTLCRRRCFPDEALVATPPHLSQAQASTLPCAALTAWSALVTEGRSAAGDTVLLLGTGGVSIAALQLAKAQGLRVVITSSSEEKLERARALGADHGVCYRTDPRWGRTVRAWTGGRGVDLVVEVGGAGTIRQSLSAVRMGGTIALIGILSGVAEAFPLTKVLMNQIRIQGILVGAREGFEAMNRAITHHGIVPVVDRCYSFRDAPAAFADLAKGAHFGKLVIELED